MAKPNAEANFRAKAPAIMAQLVGNFPITPTDAAAISGKLADESAGLATLQNTDPAVDGSTPNMERGDALLAPS